MLHLELIELEVSTVLKADHEFSESFKYLTPSRQGFIISAVGTQ